MCFNPHYAKLGTSKTISEPQFSLGRKWVIICYLNSKLQVMTVSNRVIYWTVWLPSPIWLVCPDASCYESVLLATDSCPHLGELFVSLQRNRRLDQSHLEGYNPYPIIDWPEGLKSWPPFLTVGPEFLLGLDYSWCPDETTPLLSFFPLYYSASFIPLFLRLLPQLVISIRIPISGSGFRELDIG